MDPLKDIFEVDGYIRERLRRNDTVRVRLGCHYHWNVIQSSGLRS